MKGSIFRTCGVVQHRICEARVGYGYHRVHILLDQEDWEMNWKRPYRIYREERLTERKPGTWDPRTPGDPTGTEPALVAGLRIRLPGLGSELPDPVHRRRLHQGSVAQII